MRKYNYLKYLFSDKEAKIIWIFIFVVLLFVSLISFSIHYAETKDVGFNWVTLSNFWYLGVFIIIYLGFYTSSYINFIKQASFLENISENEIEEVEVEVFQNSFTVKPIRQNIDAKINVKPKVEKFKINIEAEFFLLFGFVREFGFFRMHMKPLLVMTSNTSRKKNTVELNVRKLEIVNKDTVVHLKDNYKSISKLIVKNKIIVSS